METLKKKIWTVYREGTLNDWTYQKWFAKIHNGPWLGRQVEVDRNQIKTLTWK